MMAWLQKMLDWFIGVEEEAVEEADPVFPRVTPEMAQEILDNTGYRLKRGVYLDEEAKVCCALGLIFIADNGAQEAMRIYDVGVYQTSLDSRWPTDYRVGLERGFEGWPKSVQHEGSLHDKGYADGVALQALEVK